MNKFNYVLPITLVTLFLSVPTRAAEPEGLIFAPTGTPESQSSWLENILKAHALRQQAQTNSLSVDVKPGQALALYCVSAPCDPVTISVKRNSDASSPSKCLVSVEPIVLFIAKGVKGQLSWTIKSEDGGTYRFHPTKTEFKFANYTRANDVDTENRKSDREFEWKNIHSRQRSLSYTFKLQYQEGSKFLPCGDTDPVIYNL